MRDRTTAICPFCRQERELHSLAALVVWPTGKWAAAPPGLPHALRLRICQGCAESWCQLIEGAVTLRAELHGAGGRPVRADHAPPRKVG